MRKWAIVGTGMALFLATSARADTLADGKIIITQGHTNPACRQVWLKKADGSVLSFRMPNTGVEDGIMALHCPP